LNFRDRVAIVTGGARGIGRAISLRLADEGAAVAIVDIDAEGGQETAKLIGERGGSAFALDADVSREADVNNLVNKTISRFARLDILVNNAGVDLVASLQDNSLENWQHMQAVDTGGAFLCAKHAQPYLVRSGASAIINISSIHAFCTQPNRAAYASAKAALVGLTRALALELGPFGIRVNAILPGYIRTEIWNSWLSAVKDPEKVIDRIVQQHPLGRIGTPEDVAAAVAFLASDNASFISGTTLILDGGLTAMYVPPPI
jgi:glucose 1-dehydrogenase